MSPDPKPTIFRNHLLDVLTAENRASLAPHLTAVELDLRQEIESPNKPIEHAFFPESGIMSVVARGAHRKELEVGMFGREGMSAMTVVLGNDRSPNLTFVQLAGRGQRMSSDDLRAVMKERPAIREMFLHFVQSFMVQAAHTAISNGTGKLEERLARWLLMGHDRTDDDELPLIHDFFARMLGVRRSGVTLAIQALESKGLIKASRGRIIIHDRAGLEEIANASYGVPEAEYERLVGRRIRR